MRGRGKASGDAGLEDGADGSVTTTWWTRLRLLLVWCLGLYLAHMYIRMGWMKFDQNSFWTGAFARWGYPVWLRVTVGVVEVAGGATLIVPWIASYGGIAVAGVMCGAWITLLREGRYADVAWVSAYLLGVLWIAYEWRNTRLFRGAMRGGTPGLE